MKGYGYIRERRREPEPSAKPKITSFADVTLVLLVIFLVSASAAVAMVQVSLPEAMHTFSRDVNLAVTISISKVTPEPKADAKPAPPADKKGDEATKKSQDPWRFYFEDDTTGIEAKNLWTALREIKGGSEWTLALIRADQGTPCEHVAVLVQCLQGLGVDEIGFMMATDEDKQE